MSLDARADGVLVSHDQVWVLSGGRLGAYDPQLNPIAAVTVGSPIEQASVGQSLSAGGGSVWVGFELSDTLYRIDPDAHRGNRRDFLRQRPEPVSRNR